MPRTEVVKLRALSIGDTFYAMSDHKRSMKFKVVGDPEFNLRAGSATRQCLNLVTREIENKLCRVDVVKFVSDKDINSYVNE